MSEVGIELTIWERMTCVQVIQMQRGTVGELRTALAILDALDLTEAEKEEFDYQETARGPQWSEDAADYTKNIGLATAGLKMLRTKVNQHEGWPVSAGRRVLALVDKLQS